MRGAFFLMVGPARLNNSRPDSGRRGFLRNDGPSQAMGVHAVKDTFTALTECHA